MKNKTVKIGAGWIRELESGLKFISVKLNNDANVAIFKNDNKKEKKHPDYILKMDWDTAEAMGLISEYDWKKEKNPDNISDNEIPF